MRDPPLLPRIKGNLHAGAIFGLARWRQAPLQIVRHEIAESANVGASRRQAPSRRVRCEISGSATMWRVEEAGPVEGSAIVSCRLCKRRCHSLEWRIMRALGCLLLLSTLSLTAQSPKVHRLEATPSTIAYGYYWSEAKPVLRIASGDIIDVDTLLTNTPAGLQRAGVPPEKIQESLKTIVTE